MFINENSHSIYSIVIFVKHLQAGTFDTIKVITKIPIKTSL